MSGIVVGVDGSEGAQHALGWAAAEAKLRAVPLTVLSAWQWPAGFSGPASWAGVITPELTDDFGEFAERRLEQACEEAAAALAGLEVRPRVVEGVPSQVLIEAAADAELLVVGSRGHGGFVGLLLGSVSIQCAHHSPCPIVIVPPPQG